MRLINADALIEKLSIAKNCNDCKHNEEPYCRWKPDVVDICEAINDAPTIEPEQQWIPCTPDTMPEDGRYLCTYENEEGICVDFGRVIGGAWYIMPIAYLPLPEPYGGEQE